MQESCQVYMSFAQVNMRVAQVQKDGGSARACYYTVVGTQVHQK